MGFGLDPLKGKDLSSLRVLGTVGEPINEEAWHWYDEHIGKKKCPVVDTWWQTETGGILISNMAGITPSKPSFATLPMPGVQLVLVDENGKPVPGSDSVRDGASPNPSEGGAFENSVVRNSSKYSETSQVPPFGGDLGGAGNLCIKAPWPSILRTTYGDHERCRTNYF